MDLEQIEAYLLSEMRVGVQAVLDGVQEAWKGDFVCMSQVDDFLDALGFDTDEEIDSNGWEWDATKVYTYLGNRYSLDGHGYYGGVEFKLDN